MHAKSRLTGVGVQAGMPAPRLEMMGIATLPYKGKSCDHICYDQIWNMTQFPRTTLTLIWSVFAGVSGPGGLATTADTWNKIKVHINKAHKCLYFLEKNVDYFLIIEDKTIQQSVQKII